MRRTTSQYIPPSTELPHVEIPWKEMQWLKEDDKEKKENNTLLITSTRNFLAADQRADYENQLREAQATLREIELSLQDPDSTLTDSDRTHIQQVDIPRQKEYIRSIEKILKDFSEKGEDYKDYFEYTVYANAQLSITVTYSSDIDSSWESALANLQQNPLTKGNLEKADYGDEGRRCVTDTVSFLYFVKGDFFVSVWASGHPELAEKVGQMIESTLGMILLLEPIQVLYDKVPFVSGKKMGVFVAVEVTEEILKRGYTLSLKVSKGKFLRNEYLIPLNADAPVEFDSISETEDGSTWTMEVVEPVKDESLLCHYFGIERPRKKSVKFFLFSLKPVNLDLNGYYRFQANILDQKKKKLASVFTDKRTIPSATATIAVVPVRVGYWADPKEWLKKAVEIEGDLQKSDPNNYLYVWTDLNYTQFIESLTEEEKKKISPIQRWIKRAFQSGEGERAYRETAKRLIHFAKGVFPLAEERLVFEIFGKDNNMKIDPHESSLDVIVETLDKWAETHSFQRVVGIVPGYKKGMGGVSFGIDGIGIYKWWYGKRAVLVALQAPESTGSHELAHTYGAVDEYLDWYGWEAVAQKIQVKARGQYILNSPLGTSSGEEVKNGYWAAKKATMGSPELPRESIMGGGVTNPTSWLASSSESLAWIGPTLYRGLLKAFYPWASDLLQEGE